MAARGGSRIDATEATRLLDAPKDATGGAWVWTPVANPTTGTVVRKTLRVAVAVSPEPSGGSLLVVGDWRRRDVIQIRLVLALVKSDRNLARLCLDPAHQDELHWHYREDVPGKSERVTVSHPLGKLNEESMLFDVFIPTMRITNVAERFPI